MAQVKLKEEQELWEPAEGQQSVQILEDNSSVLRFRKEEPEEVEINAEPLQLRVVQVSVKSEDQEPEFSPHQSVEDETREDAGSEKHSEREHGGNPSDSDSSKGLSPSAKRPTYQTYSIKQLQGPAQRKHAGAEDRDSAKRHTCSHCGERFGTITKLTAHEQTHTVEKPFKCEFCEKCFPLKHRLNDHMKTHTGEKPYQCSICEMRFTWMSRLYTHMKSHTGERSFRCPICADVFTRNCHLQQHMRIHSGEKLF